jgi:hypothetical protein
LRQDLEKDIKRKSGAAKTDRPSHQANLFFSIIFKALKGLPISLPSLDSITFDLVKRWKQG